MADKPQNRWSSSFALGIPTVDSQHKGLFDLAYEVDCAVFEGKGEGVVRDIVDRLKEYCQYHFVTEEQLMHEYGYSGLHAHMLQHDEFTRAVIQFDEQQESAAKAAALNISSFLKDWLTGHIAGEDRKYLPSIRQAAPGKLVAEKGVAVFVEVEIAAKQADTAVCARVAELLMQKGVRPVALAKSVDETRSILEEMKTHGLSPAIFVVNTFGAKGILGDLDSLMGDLPILYLRRSLFAGQSGLIDQLHLNTADSVMATSVLDTMRPRLTSMWFYGARNAETISRRAAEALGAFLGSGDFRVIERTKTAE